MLAEQAKLVVSLGLADKTAGPRRAISQGFRGLNKDAGLLKKSVQSTGKSIGTGIKIGAGIAVGGLALLASQVKIGIDLLAEQQRLDDETTQALKATGNAAKTSVAHLKARAGALEDLTAVDDKEIQASENLLLRFKNVHNELGKGNDVFDRATQAALDLAKGTGKDLNPTMLKLGKALNDPIRGLGGLEKAGLTFTASEKKSIKTAVEHGDTLSAQRLILDKLSKTYGGAAAAAVQGYEGDTLRLRDAVEEARKKLATGMLPIVSRVSRRLTEFLKDPAVLKRIEGFGMTLSGFLSDKNLDSGGRKLKEIWGEIQKVDWAALGGGLSIAASAGKQAFDMFNKLDPDTKKLIIGALAVNQVTGGAVKSVLVNLAGVALKSLTSIFAGNVTVIGKNVIGPGPGNLPGPNTGPPPSGFAGALKSLAALAGGVLLVELAKPTVEDIGTQIGAHVNQDDWNAVVEASRQHRMVDMTGFQTLALGLKGTAAAEVVHTAETVAAQERQRAALIFGNHMTKAQAEAARAAFQAHTAQIGALSQSERADNNALLNSENATRATIARKQLSVQVTVNTAISVRDLAGKTQLAARYGITRTPL